MSIIPPLPFTLTNGTTADASQVMADLNTIVNNVNSQVQPGGPGVVIAAYQGASVTNSTTQTINSGVTLTEFPFDTTIVDTSSISDGAGKLTVPTGVTQVRFVLNLYGNTLSSSQVQFGLYKNGALHKPLGSLNGNIGINILGVTSTNELVNSGDYFTFYVRNFGPNPITINASTFGGYSSFEMQILK